MWMLLPATQRRRQTQAAGTRLDAVVVAVLVVGVVIIAVVVKRPMLFFVAAYAQRFGVNI